MKNILRIDKFLLNLLNLLALFNLQLLFIGAIKIPLRFMGYYVLATLTTLAISGSCHLSTKKITNSRLLMLLPDLFAIILWLLYPVANSTVLLYILGRQSMIMVRKHSVQDHKGRFFDKLSENPPVVVLLSFLATIFVGTLLLILPAATVAGKETTLLDALFTSTSATCVTGLIVHDTGTHFTLFGQMVILGLIQVGGLGIMTISSAFALIMGQKLTIKSEAMIQNVVGESNKIDMMNLVKNIVLVTFLFELVGAIGLYFTFNDHFASPARAMYSSAFHSISAFCNAGFSIFEDSFMSYRSNLNINFVITSLIIFGGIGFPVLIDIRKNIVGKFRPHRLSLHSKIVLSATATLLLLGVIGFFIAEYHWEMEGFNLWDRVVSSYFQSVTTRTAGFNTIDMSQISRGSSFFTIILMFIGASPGSTGGGIKTTAVVIILVSVMAMLGGSRDVNVFQKKVSLEIIRKVMSLIAISLAVLFVMIYLLLLVEPYSMERLVFEAVSAFATVGLSMGITPLLTSFGKSIIIMLMYLGRVGPLTMIFAISQHKVRMHYTYPEDKINIG